MCINKKKMDQVLIDCWSQKRGRITTINTCITPSYSTCQFIGSLFLPLRQSDITRYLLNANWLWWKIPNQPWHALILLLNEQINGPLCSKEFENSYGLYFCWLKEIQNLSFSYSQTIAMVLRKKPLLFDVATLI